MEAAPATAGRLFSPYPEEPIDDHQIHSSLAEMAYEHSPGGAVATLELKVSFEDEFALLPTEAELDKELESWLLDVRFSLLIKHKPWFLLPNKGPIASFGFGKEPRPPRKKLSLSFSRRNGVTHQIATKEKKCVTISPQRVLNKLL